MNRPLSTRDLARAVILPCGAEAHLLLEQAAEGCGTSLDTHQRRCEHCQAALGGFTVLWAPVADLAATPVPLLPDLTAAVMSQVRRLTRDM